MKDVSKLQSTHPTLEQVAAPVEPGTSKLSVVGVAPSIISANPSVDSGAEGARGEGLEAKNHEVQGEGDEEAGHDNQQQEEGSETRRRRT